jgi:hypothetical protein
VAPAMGTVERSRGIAVSLSSWSITPGELEEWQLMQVGQHHTACRHVPAFDAHNYMCTSQAELSGSALSGWSCLINLRSGG